MYILQGKSPYSRDTYRYTPLVAVLLCPNVFVSDLWGKALFCLCDVVTGYLIYEIQCKQGLSTKTSLFCAQLWLFNPLTLTVSSRGNAESIIATLVLSSFYLVSRENTRLRLVGGILYGLSVHMKIYPITFALPLYLFLGNMRNKTLARQPLHGKNEVLKRMFYPNSAQLQLVLSSSAAFILVTCCCYHL